MSELYYSKTNKSEEFDYNIENYNVEELRNFFKINSTFNYGIEEIEKQYQFIKKHSPNEDFDIFILQAKEILIKDFYTRKIDNYVKEQENLDIEIQRYKKEQTSILVPEIKPNINGADYNYISKKIVISSKFRKDFLNTQSNDFKIELPYLFKNVISMEFKSMEYCNSSYSISSKLNNNFFIIDGIQYTIPDGNYTNDEIVDYMNMLFENLNYEVIYNTISGKISISTKNGIPFDLSFGIADIYQELDCPPEQKYKRVCPDTKKLIKEFNMHETFGYLLGYRNFSYSGESSYTAESILDIKGLKYIYLFVDDYINSSSYDNIIAINSNEGDYFSSKILARIPNNEDNYYIKFQDSSDSIERKRHYYGPVNINKLHFRLYDERGNLVDNNNTDYSIMLELKILNK